MSDHTMTIDGGRAPGAGTFGVVNPATGIVFDQAPDCSRDQLDAAFARRRPGLLQPSDDPPRHQRRHPLSGSVWGADPDRAAAVAARLECGTAWVNTHLALAPHQPFGGAKWSGIGVENGPWGYYGFTELQVLYRAKA